MRHNHVLMEAITAACWTCLICCILGQIVICYMKREKKVKINQVLSSQWCRCKDTAKYAFGNFKEFSALNSTYTPPHDQNEKQQIKELKKYVNNWNGKGGNLVLVTHYVIILAITGETTRSGELVITDKNFKVLSTVNTF